MIQREFIPYVFWYLDTKSLLDNVLKYGEVLPESSLKSGDVFKRWVIRKTLIEMSEIPCEEEVLLILSPGLFF